jgi:tyrosine-protein phosphatase SIW14
MPTIGVQTIATELVPYERNNDNNRTTRPSRQTTRHVRSDSQDACSICFARPGFPLVPPLNFAMVATGVYRSGHPNKQNFSFLRKLGLKTIM